MFNIFSNSMKRKNKVIENQEKRLEEIIRTTTKQVVNKVFDEFKTLNTTENAEYFDKFQKKQNKQNIMIEEILEILEENKDEKQKLEDEVKSEKKSKQELVNLVLMYQEYLDIIAKHMNVEKPEGVKWKEQLDLVYSDLDHNMNLCGMETISAIAGKVDTRLHQVIETEETLDSFKNETVKSVLVPGCIYQGRVVRKAKIVAYIYNTNEREG